MPRVAPREFVGFHVSKKTKAELERLAALNERTVSGELRVALSKHLRDERAKDEVAA